MPCDPSPAANRFRLPRTVLPERYELTLSPDLQASTFSGEEAVAVRILEPVREVVLNAAELELDEAWVEVGGRRVDARVELDDKEERATLALGEEVPAGAAVVHVRFRGVLNDKLAGFYPSTWTDDVGVEHRIAATQFEATDARRAFPCWDEPDIKAVFAVTLVVDEGLTAVSNSPEISSTAVDGGKLAVRFADTMVMSTYLVAFIVGEFEATDPVDVDGVPLRVVHVPGKGHLTHFALEVGAFCLRHFTTYYGIDYPGQKVDLIALPDFASGAMENLGCITFRETLLLVERDAASGADLERVADVLAHELAHMWFGDLVTMRWWNGLWLNEAFATFMELLAVDAYKPEWDRWTSFSVSRATAQLVDGLASTRPVEFPVESPQEAESMFDVLTYQKGGSVLRMLEQYLGEESFRAGIAAYLDAHAYGNAETTDLWDAIEKATGEPVRRIMDTWIFQGGYPVITADLVDDGTVRLTQQRFRYRAPDDDGGGASWAIPLLVRSGAGAPERILLDGESVEVPVDGGGAVVVNAGGHGFYRVRYAPALLTRLTADLHALSAIERFNLVSDTWASVLAGLTPAAEFIELARLFGDEADRNVWSALLGGLGALDRILDGEARSALQRVVRDLVGPAVDKLGWTRQDGEAELVGQLRGSLLQALGILGDDPTIQGRAREELDLLVADRAAVDRDVAPAVISIIAHVGGPAEYERFVEQRLRAATPQEEQRYLLALAGFRDDALAKRTLESGLGDDVRSGIAPFLVGQVLANRQCGPIAWAFVRDNWDALLARYPDNLVVRMLEGVVTLARPELVPEIEAFLSTHPVPQGQQTLRQHLERLRVNLDLRERELIRLAGALV